MAASINIDEAEAKICQKMSIPCLRPNQRTAIKSIIEKKDVYVGTKTESGKSLTSECIPLVGEMKWRDMLKSEVYQRRLRAIVVDEAHTFYSGTLVNPMTKTKISLENGFRA
ncbi:uncharacterized protein LOC144624483 [Crassostrea virginica]